MGKIMMNEIDFSPTVNMPANTATADGAVTAGTGFPLKVWKTDENGNPSKKEKKDTTYNVVTSTDPGLCPQLVNNTNDYLRADGSWATPPDTNTTYGVVNKVLDGLCPKLENSTAKYLRSDGTWNVPPDTNTTYGVSTTAVAGLCPKLENNTSKYLRSDGTWVVPPNDNTTYGANNGIGLSGTTFYNSGVRSITTGTSNGTISVNTNGTASNVAVKGLGSAAYTASTAYAASNHNHNNTYETKIAYNSSGGWTYYKDSANVYHLSYLNDGYIVMNFNNSLGAGYFADLYQINWPVSLTSLKHCTVSCQCSSNLVTATIHSFSSSYIKLWIWSMKNGSYDIRIHMDVVST